jgi:spore maturation protein CgeB
MKSLHGCIDPMSQRIRHRSVHVLPSSSSLDIVFIGLAITSSWGNGHATTYRSLLKGLRSRGHRVCFLEQDQPWYAEHRDQPSSPLWETALYADFNDLRARFRDRVRDADAVIVGSYADNGRQVIDWVLAEAHGVRAFYDIDTPVTLRGVKADACKYLAAAQIAQFDLMLSFTGGPTLALLEQSYGAKAARALYCSVDVEHYKPQSTVPSLALAYMGTYSVDRQPGVEQFLNVPARALPEQKFMVVGAQFPATLQWPANVARREHLPPRQHAEFYAMQRFTLNVTRADMRSAGYSPSVRLFEAAACGTPIVSDDWPGLAEIFLPDEEILVAHSSRDVCEWLRSMTEADRLRIAANARERTLAEHSSLHRAEQLEGYIHGAKRDKHHGELRSDLRVARAVG